jgi:single-stranded-DNA-specific exonuclease
VTPELYQALQMLEPYGMSNPEPVFAAHATQLVAPPRILKEKHMKLKLRAGQASRELSAAAILATPRCHPDAAAIRRSDRAAAIAEVQGSSPRADFRSKITFDALGWHMAERLQPTPLLAGDLVDIAFSIGHNDHAEYGGLELSLRDFKVAARETT